MGRDRSAWRTTGRTTQASARGRPDTCAEDRRTDPPTQRLTCGFSRLRGGRSDGTPIAEVCSPPAGRIYSDRALQAPSAGLSAAEHRSETAEKGRQRSLPKDPPVHHGDRGDDGQQPPERRRMPIPPCPPDRERVSGCLQKHRHRLVPGESERREQERSKPQPDAGRTQPHTVKPRTTPAPTNVSAQRSTSPSLVRPAEARAARPSRKSDIHADPRRAAPSVSRRAPRTGISATATITRASVSASPANPTRSRSSGRAGPSPSMSRA
jgi:hypothetical protein